MKLTKKGAVYSPEVGKAGVLVKIKNKLLNGLSDITDVKNKWVFH